MAAAACTSKIVSLDALSTAQREAWSAFQAADPALASPYFAREFAETVAQVRGDTRVLVVSRGDTSAGFLPLHLPRSGIARPIAGPMGDHHGLIADETDLDLQALMADSGYGVFAFHGALAGQNAFARHARGPAMPSWYADLGGGYDAFLADLTTADAKAMRNVRARRRKLDALGDRVVFRLDDRRPEALEKLIAMKRQQYRDTGALDIFVARWTRQLIDALFARRDPGFGGLLSSLEIDGELAAAHFGMRSRTVLHYWFPVYTAKFSSFGPGLLLYLMMAEALAADGVTAIHLGPGEYDFKRRLSNASFDLVAGQVSQPSLIQACVDGLQKVDHIAQALPLGRASHWPGKALRRFDSWSAVRGL